MSLIVPSNKESDEISVIETNNLTTDQISLVKYLRENPVVAAKVLLGVTLEWYQAEALNDVWRKRFSIFCWSRQIGKTFTEAVLFALIAALYPEEDCVFIAPSLRQSMNPFNYIREFYANHAMFRSMVRGKMTKTKLEMKNNSTVTPLPLGDGCLSEALLASDGGFFYLESACSAKRKKQKVVTTDKISGENGFKEADYFFYNGHVPIKIADTKRGYQLKGSHIHPIRAIKDGVLQWVRMPDLNVGDKVVIDRRENWFPKTNDITYDEAYFVGAMIGDGNYTEQYWLGFANSPKDREIVDYINEPANKILGMKFKPISDEFHFIIRSKEKRLEFFDYFGMPQYDHRDERAYAKNKSMPSKIMSCSKDAMRGFLQGLFDTDGHVSENKAGTAREVGFTNTSERLAREVQSVLLKFGIISSLETRTRRGWNPIFNLHITGQDLILFAERIGFRLKRKQERLEKIIAKSKRNYSLTDQIYHIGNSLLAVENEFGLAKKCVIDKSKHTLWERLVERINKQQGITYEQLARFLDVYKDVEHDELVFLRDVYERHYFYDEIASIEDSEADTYDVHIPDDHTFWSNGFISHNSKILGTHASVIGIDEYARFSKEIVDTIIMPMANRKKNPFSRGNRVSIISTPLSKANHYYRTFCDYQKEQTLNPNGDYHVSTYNFLDSDNVDLDVFANQIKSMPFERFARENLAVFTSEVGGFFSEELLRQCEDELSIELAGEDGFEYVMGIDPPSVNNQLGLTLFKLTENNQKLELVYCCGIPAGYITTPQLVGLIVRFIKRFNIKRIHIDEGGGGRQVAGYLFAPGVIVDEYECPVKVMLPPRGEEIMQWSGARNADDPLTLNNKRLEPVVIKLTSFNPHNKSAMYFNVRNAMQEGAIIMPAYRPGDNKFVETNTLQGELEGLKGEQTAAGILMLRKPENLYDDRADSYVLAYDAFLGYMQKGNFPTTVKSVKHQDDLVSSNWDSRRDIPFTDRGDWGNRDW